MILHTKHLASLIVNSSYNFMQLNPVYCHLANQPCSLLIIPDMCSLLNMVCTSSNYFSIYHCVILKIYISYLSYIFLVLNFTVLIIFPVLCHLLSSLRCLVHLYQSYLLNYDQTQTKVPSH